MKYFILAVTTGLIISNPVFAQNDDGSNERQEDQERRERKADRENRKPNRKLWGILRNISDEERERLRKLHKTNPEAFKAEIAKIVKRIKAERQEKQKQNQQIKQLVKQYKNSKDDKTRQEAMDKLRVIIQKIFVTKMRENKKRLESLEKHVKKVRASYEFRQKNADKIIQARLDTLTQDTNFNW